MAQREKQATATKDASKQKFVRRAIESASEYNLFLNRQRRAERSVYMDLQTDTPNYPVGLGRENTTLTRTNKVGRFPIAVMPSQYQDWYIEYTPEELEFLPVDTVLKGPIMSIDKLPPVLTTPDVSDFYSDSDSCCSSNSSSSGECSSCCSFCVDETNTGTSTSAPVTSSATGQANQSNNTTTNDVTNNNTRCTNK